ncbi:MAG: outer membrane protein assembly factor BamC [Nitrosomonadaceae bacterium]|nr:outer membrane protein assembly factor BamC [Nitrosomonadaceae bacterium]
MRYRVLVVLCIALAITGCRGSFKAIFDNKKMNNESSAVKAPPLDVPPDLTTPNTDNRYIVPDGDLVGDATYSTYSKSLSGAAKDAAILLPIISDESMVRIERSGNQRWLIVEKEAEVLWPRIKEFWKKVGFIIKLEIPETGIMETDWAENTLDTPQNFIDETLSKISGNLHLVTERDKFRTRLERIKGGGTEIYISHHKSVKDRANLDAEIEMLNRLMVYLGVDEKRSKLLFIDSAGAAKKNVRIISREYTNVLFIDEPFDRSWRKIGLALDRSGFTVEDRDRSEGIYFVRYSSSDTSIIKRYDETSILSKLAFWRSDDNETTEGKKPEQYRIQINTIDTGSEVRILNEDGEPEKSGITDKILKLLYEQLK